VGHCRCLWKDRRRTCRGGGNGSVILRGRDSGGETQQQDDRKRDRSTRTKDQGPRTDQGPGTDEEPRTKYQGLTYADATSRSSTKYEASAPESRAGVRVRGRSRYLAIASACSTRSRGWQPRIATPRGRSSFERMCSTSPGSKSRCFNAQ